MLPAESNLAPTISVVICAYTERRWDELLGAIESVKQQCALLHEIVVVIDHNPLLLERLQTYDSNLIIIPNSRAIGLSGARNSGIAFLDEDALAARDWLAQLAAGYKHSQVLGVGGKIEPTWLRAKPDWFPPEFNWVVGCTYIGMPRTAAKVRNLIGCNMSFRRAVFDALPGFKSELGRVGTIPLGCEETELCIRIGQRWPQAELWYEPRAQVRHRVPASRGRWGYFRARCFAEGYSKVVVSQSVGARRALASERSYASRTLPRGVLRGFRDAFIRLDISGLARAGAILLGLIITTAGYISGTVKMRVANG